VLRGARDGGLLEGLCGVVRVEESKVALIFFCRETESET
jgi:hypothetical protein